ncbi:EmrB/QacA subfamily drug resistance transporter [Rhodococcus fascians]|uniref:MFS transporter n=1 Tax=Nocardiaceae TaxID=85025 RepID=UPI002860FEB4|nr:MULTISPECIES: MFS transporter [Rhodococcus]MDR6912933.1 EmrB/QacA subfamily drug resistance transporter [Rhodococcus sp. 3258]MDR6934530.1 EmrB/QacA subfamily drug resistance transporter [Rhodococcus fascians]
MAVVGIAQLMVMLDATVVNVAIPSIGRDLTTSTAALQWVISGYVLMYGSLLLFGGRLADVLGRRRAFVTGLTLFALTSIWCGLATAAPLLISGRILQGASAAVLSSAALSIVISTYTEPGNRRVALTAWSGLGVLGATLGVVLGGVIVDLLSWRWVFLINVVFAVAAGIAAYRVLLPLRATTGRSLRIPTAALVSIGLAALTYALIELQNGLSEPRVWIFFAAAVVILGAIGFVEARSTDPLLPLYLLRIRTYLAASIGLMLAAAVMISSSYLGSLYFQDVHGMSPLLAGLSLLPMGLASLLVALILPKFIASQGPVRTYIAGVGAQLIGAGVLASGLDTIPATIALLALIGAGLPSAFVPLYGVGASHVELKDSGVGSGLLNTFNQTGGALGIAVVGTVMAAVIRANGDTSSQTTLDGVGAGFLAVALAAAAGLVVAVALRSLTRPKAG